MKISTQTLLKDFFEKSLRIGGGVINGLLLVFFLVCGCSEHQSQYDEMSGKRESRENILSRISNLNIDYICPASGITGDFKHEYKKDIARLGIEIPQQYLDSDEIYQYTSDYDGRKILSFFSCVFSDSKIIWNLRGGYGSYKFPSLLRKFPRPRSHKFFIGFSDITALNIYISQNWKNWTVIHGPLITNLALSAYDAESWEILLDILEKKVNTYKISDIEPLNEAARRNKKIVGKLTGGNLTLVESSLKTSWEIDTNNKILFLEDCNEHHAKIYRSMHHLKNAGKLTNVKAIIFGNFFNSEGYEKYLKNFAQELNIPVFITDKFGHGTKNLPLVYNADGTITDNELTVDIPNSL